MNFEFANLDLRTERPFRIARRRRGGELFENILLRVFDASGLVGEAESHPTRYYGETREISLAALRCLRDELPQRDLTALLPRTIAEIMNEADGLLAGNPAAKAALNCALWDLLARQRGVSVSEVLLEGADALSTGSAASVTGAGVAGEAGAGGDPANPAAQADARIGVETSFTIGLAEPDEMLAGAERAMEQGFRLLKIKCGWPGDVETVERICLLEGARVRVDANGAWRVEDVLPQLERLAMAGVELAEQPLPADDLAGYRLIAARAPLPIVLDESITCSLDLDVFGEYADGVNLKISKMGGLSACLAVAERARMMKLDLMLGCMIESSLGIAQALQLAPLVRWADLDGALLLAEDPFQGLGLRGAMLERPAGPGYGVQRRKA